MNFRKQQTLKDSERLIKSSYSQSEYNKSSSLNVKLIISTLEMQQCTFHEPQFT